MKTLLACPTARAWPSQVAAGKGLPVATMARPSLQARMSSGAASTRLDGFERAKTTGPLDALGHRPDDLLVEGARLARRADEDVRAHGADDLAEATVVVAVERQAQPAHGLRGDRDAPA